MNELQQAWQKFETSVSGEGHVFALHLGSISCCPEHCRGLFDFSTSGVRQLRQIRINPRATRCSKYVLGCQQVGRIMGSEL